MTDFAEGPAQPTQTAVLAVLPNGRMRLYDASFNPSDAQKAVAKLRQANL